MTIGITATPTVLVEEEGTVVTLTLTSTDPIPDGGLVLTIDSGATRALSQFDVFATEFTNVRLVGVTPEVGGFIVRLTEQTGTLSLPVFDDNVADSPLDLTFALQPSEDYTIDPEASSFTVTILDEESSIGDNGGDDVDNNIGDNGGDDVDNNIGDDGQNSTEQDSFIGESSAVLNGIVDDLLTVGVEQFDYSFVDTSETLDAITANYFQEPALLVIGQSNQESLSNFELFSYSANFAQMNPIAADFLSIT